MPPEPVDPRWVELARRRLTAGNEVHAVLVDLLRDGAAPDAAAIAVCVAAGSSREEAVERLRQFAGLWDVIQPGEEADGVDLLIAHGYFEPDAALDERQQSARAYLRAALSALPAIPSGFAFSLSTRIRTGRLVEAYQKLENLGGRRWPDNARFWAAMRRAGEILDPDSDRSGLPE
jgi:hypothetical protein